MITNLRAVAAGGALAFALAGAVSPAVAGGSAYPAGGTAGPVLAARTGTVDFLVREILGEIPRMLEDILEGVARGSDAE